MATTEHNWTPAVGADAVPEQEFARKLAAQFRDPQRGLAALAILGVMGRLLGVRDVQALLCAHAERLLDPAHR